MELLIASNNKKKLKELKEILSDYFDVYSLSEKGIDSNPEETGTTFEENAEIKAVSAMKASGIPALADDSGLCVEALNGQPGVYSSRYAGEDGNDLRNNKLLLKNMEGKENRKAKFVSSIVLVYPDGRKISANGECYGEILKNPRGENGFGYDPLFYLPEYDKTMAEIDAELKNKISHRANAIQKFLEELKESYK